MSLDIKSAFDNAWWPALLNQLSHKGCPSNIMTLVSHYWVDSEIELTYAGSKISKTMTKGCIQGAVCGPTFWNVILDQLFSVGLPNGCYLQAFADDVLLIGRHKNINRLKENIEEALAIIDAWGRFNKLIFGPEKTQLIAFTPAARKIGVTMNGVTFVAIQAIKLLGVIIEW